MSRRDRSVAWLVPAGATSVCTVSQPPAMIQPSMTTHATVNPPAATAPPHAPPLGSELVRLLADPLRARLVTLLAREELCTCHLAEETGALPTAVSNHLRRLRRAGVVEREAAGRYTYYRLRPEVLDELSDQFAQLAERARSAGRRAC